MTNYFHSSAKRRTREDPKIGQYDDEETYAGHGTYQSPMYDTTKNDTWNSKIKLYEARVR